VIAASAYITQLSRPRLADRAVRPLGRSSATCGALGPSLVQVLLFCLYVLIVSFVKPQWVRHPARIRTMTGAARQEVLGIIPS